MKTQIQKYGNSTIIRLDRNFLKFNDLSEGDWVDISGIKKVTPTAEELVNDLNKEDTK